MRRTNRNIGTDAISRILRPLHNRRWVDFLKAKRMKSSPVQGSLFPWDSVVCVSAWLRRSKHRSGGPQRWPHLLVPVVLARARSSLKLEGDTRGASHNRTDSVSSQPIEVLRKILLFRTTLACSMFFVLNINYLYHFFTRLVITQKFISINNATQRKKCNSYSGSKIEDGRNYF